MTGSGTQADPYVPSTWGEFVTAIGTSGVYVSLAEGTVWDMNEIAPEGLSTDVPVRCKEIQGNGTSIKNLFIKDDCFKMITTNNTSWSDIKFLNVLVENNAILFMIGTNIPLSSPSMSHITISGKIVDSTLFYGNHSQANHQLSLNGCSINVELSDSSYFARVSSGAYPCVKLSNCHIRTVGNSTQAATQYMQLENSLWEGDWAIKSSQIVGGNGMVSQYNIFDVAVPATVTVSVNSSYASNVKKCIFNSDKITSGATLASQLVQVTSEQLRDASYLSSIGFPIATT